MMKRRSLLWSILTCVLASGLTACHSNQAGGTHVRVAINLPLTGPIAAWSGQYANGFKMGLEETSQQLNVPVSTFSVDVQDNAGDPSQALSIFKKQELNGFQTYISVTTGTANAIAPQLDGSNTPHFIAAFDPFITQSSPNRMRLMANSKVEAPVFLDYAKRVHARNVYVVHLNFSYAEDECSKIVIPALRADGATVNRERFELSQRDFKGIVAKLKKQDPDLIFFVGYSFHVQPFVRDLQAAGMLKRGRLVTSMDFLDLLSAGNSPAQLKDAFFVAPIFNIEGQIPGAAEWRARFKNRFGTDPTYVPAYAYDTASLLVRTYAANHNVDVPSLMTHSGFTGVNGTINFDKDRDVIATVALAEVDSAGNVVAVK